MDAKKIQELAIDSGLIDISPSEKTGRYFVSSTASLAEILLFARMVEKEKEEELKYIRRLEVGG